MALAKKMRKANLFNHHVVSYPLVNYSDDIEEKMCIRDRLIADDFKKFIADTNPDLTEDEVIQIYDNVRLVGAESDFATLHKVYGLSLIHI